MDVPSAFLSGARPAQVESSKRVALAQAWVHWGDVSIYGNFNGGESWIYYD